MFAAIKQGIGLGFFLAILIGPVFFALINTSLTKGFKSALFLAIGISISDIFYIAITLIGVNSFLHNPIFNYWLGIAGGFILILFGLQSILKKQSISRTDVIIIDSKHIIRAISKGFLLNSLHPGVVLFWLATVSGVVSKSDFTFSEIVVLFSFSILTTFCIDIFKIKIADKLSYLLTQSFIKKLNSIIDLVLIICGFYLFYTTYLDKTVLH